MVDWRSDDRELLARILTAEAGNQGPVGMLAAGNVIMNRANTTGYGDGVRGVIMRPGQFSPMNSVTGYAGGEQGQNIDALTPSQTAYMVADSLLSGTANDITGGATHFYNPDISQPSWAEGREFTRIGDHVFGRADAERGATPTPRVSTMNQPMQSQPEQERPRGLRGLLSNPDFFDRLAIGLGGMTLNPNTALMQMSADRIAGRREERTTRETGNRTAEWLRSQGRDDLADAVLSGAMGSREAATIAYQQPEDNRTSVMKNYEFFLSQGMTPEQAMSAVRSGATINMPGAPTIGTIPPGYQAIQDPQTGRYTLERIEGGPAAAEAETIAGQRAAQADTAANSLALIDSVINDPYLPSVTGMGQGRVPALTQPGTDLVIKIEQLQGQAFLEAFESLKGGGAITEREGLAAQNAIARLNRAQSAEAFTDALRELRGIFDRGRRRALGEDIPDMGTGIVVGEPYQ